MLSAAKIGARVRAVHEKARPGRIASALIDEKINELGDWRGKALAKVRKASTMIGQTRKSELLCSREYDGQARPAIGRRLGQRCARPLHKQGEP
jgi:hypothetical protein